MGSTYWTVAQLLENDRWSVSDIRPTKQEALKRLTMDPDACCREHTFVPLASPHRYLLVQTDWRNAADRPPASLTAVPEPLELYEEGECDPGELYDLEAGLAAVQEFNHAARFDYSEDDGDSHCRPWAVLVELGEPVGSPRYQMAGGANGVGWRRVEVSQAWRVVTLSLASA